MMQQAIGLMGIAIPQYYICKCTACNGSIGDKYSIAAGFYRSSSELNYDTICERCFRWFEDLSLKAVINKQSELWLIFSPLKPRAEIEQAQSEIVH